MTGIVSVSLSIHIYLGKTNASHTSITGTSSEGWASPIVRETAVIRMQDTDSPITFLTLPMNSISLIS